MLDLSIARIRMLMATISAREKERFKRDAHLVEWSTKIIASTVAATTGKEGAALQKAVAKMKLPLDDETTEDQADTLSDSAPGAEVNGLPDYVIHGSRTAENKMGSTEALFGRFGN